VPVEIPQRKPCSQGCGSIPAGDAAKHRISPASDFSDFPASFELAVRRVRNSKIEARMLREIFEAIYSAVSLIQENGARRGLDPML